MNEIADRLTVAEFPAGTKIISEDEPADSFYLVKEGSVDVHKKTKFGQDAKLTVIGSGHGFGEMALLTCSSRCCSVTAATDVVLYRLLRRDFDEIVRVDASFNRTLGEHVQSYSLFNSIKTLQPFALLDPAKMDAITGKLQEKKFTAGQDIVVQGEPGDEYFIIKSGRVEVWKLMFEDEPEYLTDLVAGQGFGEEALINDSPRNATVRAAEDTVVWSLAKPAFDEVMISSFLQEIDAGEVLESGLPEGILDVRMDIEFEEEHIPGSVLIPLDEIRQRYHELQKDKLYYIICRSGRRSASAAFLMNSQGFNAKSIRGGMSDWPGPVTDGADGVHNPVKPT